MKAIILAGGLGTRIQEESRNRPKPMVEIGGKPILWHIMKIFYHYGVNEFVICCGYKGYQIKEYFANYLLHMSDVTLDFETKCTTMHKEWGEKWKVSLCDTGEDSLTGERLKRVKDFLPDNEPFFFTYGDGLADVNISNLLSFHKSQNKLATLTAVLPLARYGAIDINKNTVQRFKEKPQSSEAYVNGGFFVLEKNVLDYIKDDNESWEGRPLEALVASNEVAAFKHHGFWQAMDTLRDKNQLEKLWLDRTAPWKLW